MKTSTAGRQTGISMIGFILAMVVVVMAGIVVMKVAPMYIEYNSVKQSLNALSQEQYDSATEVRQALTKRLNINYVETLQKEDITIKEKNGKYSVAVDYYVDKPLVANLSLSAHFQHEVTTK